jgi:hypothetical protein
MTREKLAPVMLILWLVPLALAATLWFWPPRGDDSYHHTINAIEQARAWDEGAVMPRYHRGWNGGTGTFIPTIYSPISQSVQGGLAHVVGDGQRAVGLSLAVALLVAAIALVGWSGQPMAIVVLLAPYLMAVSLSRSTTTEAWALAGAAVVLPLAMPPVRMTRRRGLGLAAGVLLIAGCQVGMLLQIGWLLGAAWAVTLVLSLKGPTGETQHDVRGLAGAACWGAAGLAVAAILWIPAVFDARHLAIAELISGPLDWRHNFLPDGSELGLLLTATAVSLGVIAIVVARGKGRNRFALAAAVGVGVVLSTPLSAFPWRSLGPTTLVAIIALAGLRGRWRTAGIVVLLLPLTLLPIRIGSYGDSVPTSSTPEELALIAQQQWNLFPVLPTTAGLYAPQYHRLDSLDHLAAQLPQLDVVNRDVDGGTWRITSESAGSVLLPIQWWPEWRIEAGGDEMPYVNKWGLVEVELEEGIIDVHASLANSKSRIAGMVVSLLGLAALLLLSTWWGRDQRPVPMTQDPV